MGKKRIQKIPVSVILKCPYCSKKSRALVSKDYCPQSFICPKCKQEVKNPVATCCVICAFSSTKCPRTLYSEARVKGYEIREG